MKQSILFRFFILTTLVTVCASFSADNNSTGINFFHGSYQQALAEAKKEGKLVFIDAYTTWCGPCRLLSQNTFTNEEVGCYFNEHFVNLKVDMEHGEGPKLAVQYKVTHFPTLIITDADGKRITFTVGYIMPEDMLGFGQYGIKQHLPELSTSSD
jgi:thioredoxin 1